MSKPGNRPSDEPEEKPENEQAGEQTTPQDELPKWQYVSSITKPGFVLEIPINVPDYDWIFIALPKFDGVIISQSEDDGSRWKALHAAGMPEDMYHFNVIFSPASYGEKYRDFAVVGKGVRVDRENPEKGISAKRFVYELPLTRLDAQTALRTWIEIHIWIQILYYKGSRAFLASIFNIRPDNKFLDVRRVGLNDHLFYGGDEREEEEAADKLWANRVLLKDSQAVFDAAIKKQGGKRYVKVADLSEGIRRALGSRYAELGESLTSIKQDAKAACAILGDGWRNHILQKYPILGTHLDLLEEINPYREPNDSEASEKVMDPWHIAMEIAARETVPGHKDKSMSPDAKGKDRRASADALRRIVILPDRENK